MKVFDGRKASQDYMSSHTLAFSTPDLTLTRFALWLGEMVPDPADRKQTVPRLYTFVEEKDFEPVQIVDDERYVPTGAVRSTSIYGTPSDAATGKFCADCGAKMASAAKFCPQCGTLCDPA